MESRHKEKLAEAKAEAFKKFLEMKRKRKKNWPTVRQDSIKARSLSAAVRGRERGEEAVGGEGVQ